MGLIFNDTFDDVGGGLFGDFRHPLYYVFSIVNGVLLCLPDSKNMTLRWLSFLGKSILSVFILYFFIVFIPFLPISIIAIVAIGFGFLMLAPVIVFVYQIAAIRNDILFLTQHYSKTKIHAAFVLSILVFPVSITLNYKMDRIELNQIFTFLYSRSYDDEEHYSFNENRVDRLLSHLQEVKLPGVSHTPFLDSYYNWIVLDNLLISDKKLQEISSVFQGKPLEIKHKLRSWFFFPTQRSIIDSFYVESTYSGNHWTSYVHLEAKSNDSLITEFRAFIETPNDCFISNFYLDIEGKREYGILAEKKSANWVYNNIVKTRRDPGILNAVGHNKYELKVFPVPKNENRFTGIEFTHKEPIEIKINKEIISLGDSSKMQENVFEIEGGSGLYIPSHAKNKLSKIRREPEYHFVIDRSINNNMSLEEIENTLSVLKKELPSSNNYKLWASNYNAVSLSRKTWKEEIANHENVGGFFPEFLMKKILINSYSNHSNKSPIFVLITSDTNRIDFLEGFSNLMFTSPDMKYFHTCNGSLNTQLYELESARHIGQGLLTLIYPDSSYVSTWNNVSYYLPANNKAEIIIGASDVPAQTTWQKGVQLQQKLNRYAMNPSDETAWVSIIQASINSGILSPLTSYLSLENEAQKKALFKKQKEVIESNQHFDLEEAEPMSEPSIIWYLLALILGYLGFNRKLN